MDMLISVCAGMDVHKKFVIACRRRWSAEDGCEHETRRFSTMTRDLEALAAWLDALGCTDLAMEQDSVSLDTWERKSRLSGRLRCVKCSLPNDA